VSGAAQSIWENGPVGPIGSPLRRSTRSFWKRPAKSRETHQATDPVSKTLEANRKTAWAWIAGTFLGAGMLRPGPGTWGSAAGALVWFAAGEGFRLSRPGLAWITLAGALVTIVLGVAAGTRVEMESGRQDPGQVVIDEVAGQWIALLYAPVTSANLLAAFLFFRLFDILKPWPARRLEKFPGGWGIMLDDVAAGVYALLVVQVLQTWIRR
jgi:phosphatidylglycerophosphatase A